MFKDISMGNKISYLLIVLYNEFPAEKFTLLFHGINSGTLHSSNITK